MRNVGNYAVGPIALGGAGWSIYDDADDRESIRTVHAALDCGVRLLDTALAYSRSDTEGHSEQIVARALAGHPLRNEVLVATKGGHYRRGDAFPVEANPEKLRRDVEGSLRRLGVERIGLYFIHKPDPAVPFQGSVGALFDLQAEGMIEHVGVSNVTLSQLRLAQTAGDIAAVENRFSPLHDDRTVLDACAAGSIRKRPEHPSQPLTGRLRQHPPSQPVRPST